MDSSQTTYLEATALWPDDSSTTYQTTNDQNGHAEDNLIAQLFAHGGTPAELFISINRSPCTSTDRANNQSTTSHKPVGVAGCAERLIALKGVMGMAPLVVTYRDLYGSGAPEEVNSVLALEAMHNAGIQVETHQLGGPDSNQFRHTKTAKLLSIASSSG